MAKLTSPCHHEDYPCCGCGGVEVLTGQDALDAFWESKLEEDFDGPEDNFTDAEADADTLASAGMGTDEDYGCYDTPMAEDMGG